MKDGTATEPDKQLHLACLTASTVANYLRTNFSQDDQTAFYEDEVVCIRWIDGPPRPWEFDEDGNPRDPRDPALQVTIRQQAGTTVLRVSPRNGMNQSPTVFIPGPWMDHLHNLLPQTEQNAKERGHVLPVIPGYNSNYDEHINKE